MGQSNYMNFMFIVYASCGLHTSQPTKYQSFKERLSGLLSNLPVQFYDVVTPLRLHFFFLCILFFFLSFFLFLSFSLSLSWFELLESKSESGAKFWNRNWSYQLYWLFHLGNIGCG